MPFPSRGCRTCKQRRVKCDETRPVCNRCQKAKLNCDGVKDDGGFIFLNENEYAVGTRKRPRGPNVKHPSVTVTRHERQTATPSRTDSLPGPRCATLSTGIPPSELRLAASPSPALAIPLHDQALAYYSHCRVHTPCGSLDLVDDHFKYATVSHCYYQPDSVLSLAIYAVSHAIFGRARKSHAALAVGSTQYSAALIQTNQALRDANAVTDDGVLLAVMLLSFYENSVMDRTSHIPGREIKDVAPQSFAHHDGAMAVLGLRRRSGRRSDHSLDLDKLVRRQLVRSLLLRSMPVPLWLRDGAAFGEPEFALELDRCMVRAGELRHQASRLLMSPTSLSVFEKADETARLQNLLAEAQALDDSLERWTHSLPPEHRYSVHTVQGRNGVAADNRILDNIVHIYPTMGHAGMWNRYRALGISVKAIALQSFTLLDTSPTSPSTCLTQTVQSQIEQLASDFCASIPYVFGLVKATDHSDQTTNEPDNVVSSSVTTVPGSGLESLKATVKPSTAAWLLCWPLAMAMMVEQIPARQKQYLRDRLRDVSEIVEDGVLERIAGGAVG